MAFLAPIGAAIAKGVTAIGGASTLSTIATGVGMAGSFVASQYQAGVARNQADLLTQQAEQARERGQINQQETDFEAFNIMGQNQTRRAGSGFSTSSTSFNASRRMERMLARRDAYRIRDDAQRESLSLLNQAAAKKSEAKALNFGSFLDLAGGGFELGGDLISSATLVNKKKTSSLKLEG